MAKKKKSSKIIKHPKGADKRWMRATRGSITFRSVSFFIFGIGFLGLAAAIIYYVRVQHIVFTPLPVVSHTTEVPDTGELLRRINEERTRNDRGELTVDDRLKAVAEKRLRDMIEYQQYAHKDFEGKYYYDLLPEQGYAARYSCENLDIEPTVKPNRFVQSWLNSGGGHKECLLSDKVAKIGVASGKFSQDDKTFRSNFLVVAIFAADPPDPDQEQEQ